MQVQTEQSGWRLRGSRGGPDTHPKLHPQRQKLTRRHAHKHSKCTKKQKLKNLNIQTSSEHHNNKYKEKFTKKQKTTENTKCGRLFFFLRAGQFLQIRLGRNYETRRSSSVPKGAECSLLTLSWRAREMFDSNERDAELCLCSVTTSKWVATASLACGNVREHAAAREGGGRPRENAVPRHRQVTCPQLVNVRSQTCAERVSFSAVFSPQMHRRGSEKCSRHLVPTISYVRLVCFTKTNMSRASPSSLLWSTLEILPSSSLGDVSPNAGCQPGNSNFYTATPLVCQYLFVSPPCFSKRVTARRRHRCKFIYFGVRLRFHPFVFFILL